MPTAEVVDAAPTLEQPPFAALGAPFITHLHATPLPAPYWVVRNGKLARSLGLDPAWFASDDALAAFSGNTLLAGSEPFAEVYSGHQFGVWAGQLGDGRALMLGQMRNGNMLQLKGSGRTPYSRGADGRAVLRSSIREFLCSEAMHALGIPTTRALCVAGSDAPVYRETIETAAVLTRVSPSFLRFGHFEHFCHLGRDDELRRLADFAITRFYPDCAKQPAPYTALLEAVIRRTAALIARWQAVGFMHGVMNTDNMSLIGLTLDYGPFQFMDAYDPAHVCNHSDSGGRYAYRNQPAIAQWNLAALATALLPLIGSEAPARAALARWPTLFEAEMAQRWAEKLGFAAGSDTSTRLARDLLALMAQNRADYTLFWRALTHYAEDGRRARLHLMFSNRSAIDALLDMFDDLAAGAGHSVARMRHANPAVVLRNWMAQEAIAAAQARNFAPLQELLTALQNPFEEPRAHPTWMEPPPAWAERIQVSCSS